MKRNDFRLLTKIKRCIQAFVYYIYNHLVTNVPIYSVRHFYLRRLLRIKIGSNSAIHMGCFFTGNKIVIGNNTVVNRNCYLDGRFSLEIGDNVSVSPETFILSLTHDLENNQFEAVGKKTVIMDYVWIGVRAIVLPGVRLGKGSVVGAGSVVTKSCKDYEIIGGMPARKIGTRKVQPEYTLRYFPLFDTDVTL
jgi:maltose O-acetyltransferase